MKERWPEMLEYQQKVQAMTDLEKARSELLEIVSQVSQGSWSIVLLASVERVIETARREGCALPTEPPEWFLRVLPLYVNVSPYTGKENCEDLWTEIRTHILGEDA